MVAFHGLFHYAHDFNAEKLLLYFSFTQDQDNGLIGYCGLDEETVCQLLLNCPELIHPLYDVLIHNIPCLRL